ncbi:hypothetical protein WN48_00656 [Eufriesea mexicana]|uniref:Uncharacterized protein n=1 Tax=Eufriesea mexicana TaxID=516756 RepID=A0A310SLP7_9HYME|nr:hypothetical protein WN48_00656 [Eufriesea mexicana]
MNPRGAKSTLTRVAAAPPPRGIASSSHPNARLDSIAARSRSGGSAVDSWRRKGNCREEPLSPPTPVSPSPFDLPSAVERSTEWFAWKR